jgi:hypothetical protein
MRAHNWPTLRHSWPTFAPVAEPATVASSPFRRKKTRHGVNRTGGKAAG